MTPEVLANALYVTAVLLSVAALCVVFWDARRRRKWEKEQRRR